MAAKAVASERTLTEIHLGLLPVASNLDNDALLRATAKANHERTSAANNDRPGKPSARFAKWKTLTDEITRRDLERELIRLHDRPRYEREIVLADWRKPRPMYV
jgi:hypothetical protein